MTDYEVFIPAYNAARTLAATIVSLQQQEIKPRRITVLDDGSTDETAAIAASSGATVLTLDHGGLYAAQNSGIRAAESGLLAFVDADDLWHVEAAGRLIAALASDPALAAVSGSARTFTADLEIEEVLAACGQPLPPRADMRPVTPAMAWNANPLTKSATLFRLSALMGIGGYRALASCEDYDVVLRLLADGWRIGVIDDAICWRFVSHSTMTARSSTMLEAELRVLGDFYGCDYREAELPSARFRRRALLAWTRALARDARYWGTVHQAPDPPLSHPRLAKVAGRLVRGAPDVVARVWPAVRDAGVRSPNVDEGG